MEYTGRMSGSNQEITRVAVIGAGTMGHGIAHVSALAGYDTRLFDVNAEGEAVIPIQASLVVNKPYLFAITIERPGGVAKIDKSAVPLIAGPPDGA